MSEEEIERLFEATRECLSEWIERLRADTGTDFPERVTAFRADMAVHGKYREPCPVCGAPVQRIVYAENETNYCPKCQTGGKLLADRRFVALTQRRLAANSRRIRRHGTVVLGSDRSTASLRSIPRIAYGSVQPSPFILPRGWRLCRNCHFELKARNLFFRM